MNSKLLLPGFLALFLAVAGQAGTLATFHIAHLGDIQVELFDQEKPITTQNFLNYVRSGAYQNSFLHRCIPGFVVQGGGFVNQDPNSIQLFTTYYSVQSLGPITNEFNVGPLLHNTFGTLAMAKISGDPNSATSEWFFNLADNSTNLDIANGGFTVFGQVVRGTNVLGYFNQLSLNQGVVDLTQIYGPGASVFSDLPVYYFGPTPPHYNQLFYTDITLLQAQVNLLSDGSRQISWNSVSNAPNIVEFATATNFPATWKTLVSTNGTGGLLSVRDKNTNAATTFYRIRVDF